MSKRYKIWSVSLMILGFCLGSNSTLRAQLSPGKLAEPHAHLEGLFNCTKCHTLGEKINNQKCLDCHTHINDRLQQNQGYHASTEVKGKDCFSCHSDHHGRDFEMIRFDKTDFDHTLTGYTLEGAHREIDCAECHKTAFIKDPEIREKKRTFLGLETDCLSCHDDFHQGELSNNCLNCHNFESFRPAVHFEHANTDFPLLGQHKEVDCKECHPITTEQGQEYQAFTGLEFSQCTACHTDAHNNRLGTDCMACHSEQSFQFFTGGAGFDHTTTDFPLRGKHRVIDCKACHTVDLGAEDVFRDYEHVDHSQCITCHEDVHDNKFGSDCRDCHNENSFQMAGSMDDFDHDLTAFSLEGKHVEVDCRACHTEKLTDPLPHQNCTDCHEDYHDQQFVENGISPDCVECHTVAGFELSTFSIEDHAQTAFPLKGAHVATPCFACHLPDEEEKWQFKNIGLECIDCHENIHEGSLEEKYYVDVSCTYCHSSNAWNDIAFEHDSTAFPLEGAHLDQECSACHFETTNETSEIIQTFAGLSTACASCHEDPHRGQFSADGVTTCDRCHGPDMWSPSQFDHDSTAFALEGAHEGLDCLACHREIADDGYVYIDYQIEQFECIDCHK